MKLSVDPRIARTKLAIHDALLILMKHKDFKAITVSDIVRQACLNRGTFYKHYQYKEDILEEIINFVTDEFIESYREPYKKRSDFKIDSLSSSAIKIFDHVFIHQNFYTLMMSSKTFYGFQSRLVDMIKQLVLQDILQNESARNPTNEFLASYHAYAIIGLIVEWVKCEFKYSPDYMAEQLLAIIQNQSHDDRTFS